MMMEPFPTRQSDQLHQRVIAFVDSVIIGEQPDETFDHLALDIAAWQAAQGNGLERLLRARGESVSDLTSVAQVPAVPTDVFKLRRVACHPEHLDIATFRTSGTTVGDRGAHHMRTLSTYQHVSSAWAKQMLVPDGEAFDWILLAQPHRRGSDSSLGFMLDHLARSFGQRVTWALQDGKINARAVREAAASAGERDAPVVVAGASFAYVHLLDELGSSQIPLGKRARVLLTGGFKGRSRTVSSDELQARICALFDISPHAIVGEYGMTELTSQAYQSTVRRLFGMEPADPSKPPEAYLPPPWMRVVPVDPVTLVPTAPGQEGIARIVDLANVDSAVAVLTADRVRQLGPGIELLGRTQGATPRGCSIGVDELLDGS